MPRIPNPAADVDQNQTANATNSASAKSAPPPTSIPESGSKEEEFFRTYREIVGRSKKWKSDKRPLAEKEAVAFAIARSMVYGDQFVATVPPSKTKGTFAENQYAFRLSSEPKPPAEWHKFSKSLAIELNPKQPDFAGAAIIYGLHLWMGVAKRGIKKTDYCYRSLRELEKDHPYLDKGGIEHALKRLEKKLKGSFEILRNGDKLRYRLTDKLRKRMDNHKDTKLMFRIEQAAAYGIREALLLANLSWQTAPSAKEASPNRPSLATKDDNGVCYYELSPTKLTKKDDDGGPILPIHRGTVSRLLSELEEKGVITSHPAEKTYYAFSCSVALNNPLQTPAAAKQSVAERDKSVTERDSSVAERDSYPYTYSNDVVIADSKVTFPATVSASPSLCGEEASPSLRKLMDFVALDMKDIDDRRKAKEGTRHRYNVVPPSQLPYDLITHPSQDLPYDYYPTLRGGTIYTRDHHIKDYLKELTAAWRRAKFRYTKADITAIRSLFYAVPTFTTEHFEEILGHLIPNRFTLFGPGELDKPRRGQWDPLHFSRIAKDATTLVRYLPDLIEEMHLISYYDDDDELVKSGCMEEPFEDVITLLRSPRTIPVESAAHESNPVGA